MRCCYLQLLVLVVLLQCYTWRIEAASARNKEDRTLSPKLQKIKNWKWVDDNDKDSPQTFDEQVQDVLSTLDHTNLHQHENDLRTTQMKLREKELSHSIDHIADAKVAFEHELLTPIMVPARHHGTPKALNPASPEGMATAFPGNAPASANALLSTRTDEVAHASQGDGLSQQEAMQEAIQAIRRFNHHTETNAVVTLDVAERAHLNVAATQFLSVEVTSWGYQDLAPGRISMLLNGKEVAIQGRGICLVVVDEVTGQVNNQYTFDTYADGTASGRLFTALSGVPNNKYILMGVMDDGSNLLASNTRSLIAAYGGSEIYNLAFRQGWAFIGCVNCKNIPGVINRRTANGAGPSRVTASLPINGGPGGGIYNNEFDNTGTTSLDKIPTPQGVQLSGSGSWGIATTSSGLSYSGSPSGTRFGYVDNGGILTTRIVGLTIGSSYQTTWREARPGSSGQLTVVLDKSKSTELAISPAHDVSNTWGAQVSVVWKAYATSYDLSFVATGGTILIDAILQPITNGAWTDWSQCSSQCTPTGAQPGTQTRTCTNPAPANGGSACTGDLQRVCNNNPCPINGAWSPYGACSVPCGGGSQIRTCTNPAPTGGGKTCDGVDRLACNTAPCSIDGSWTDFGKCSVDCGGGQRSRQCTNPPPKQGGKLCPGDEFQNCNQFKCPKYTASELYQVLHLDAASVNTVNLKNGKVVQWMDKSGGLVHAVQAGETTAPTYKTSAVPAGFTVAVTNAAEAVARPVIHFDKGQYLKLVGFPGLKTIPDYTMFIVARGTGGILLSGQKADQDLFALRVEITGGSNIVYTHHYPVDMSITQDAATSNTGEFSSGEFTVISTKHAVSDPTDHSVWLNSRGRVSVNHNPTVTTFDANLDIALGADSIKSPSVQFEGDIAEIIIYANKLDDTSRHLVEMYLAEKWLAVHPCDPLPCKNGGQCVMGSKGITTYTCQCPQGKQGDACEFDDLCATTPCHNGATCSSIKGALSCQCADGWQGATCDTFSREALLAARITHLEKEGPRAHYHKLLNAIADMKSEMEDPNGPVQNAAVRGATQSIWQSAAQQVKQIYQKGAEDHISFETTNNQALTLPSWAQTDSTAITALLQMTLTPHTHDKVSIATPHGIGKTALLQTGERIVPHASSSSTTSSSSSLAENSPLRTFMEVEANLLQVALNLHEHGLSLAELEGDHDIPYASLPFHAK